MKIVTSSKDKKTVKISKSEWQKIGRTAGWLENIDSAFENFDSSISLTDDKRIVKCQQWFINMKDKLKEAENNIKSGKIRNKNQFVDFISPVYVENRKVKLIIESLPHDEYERFLDLWGTMVKMLRRLSSLFER